LSTGGERSIRHGPHEADVSTSIDDREAFTGEKAAERLRGGTVRGIVSGAGAAIDADAMEVAHEVGFVVRSER
jgi:hypothetical protein